MLSGQFRNLYYITHVDNLPSILERGILSHSRVEEEDVDFKPIYDSEIVTRRSEKKLPNGKSLWQYANLYFQPRNPMLYRVIYEQSSPDDIIILGIHPAILKNPEIFLSDGNAANDITQIVPIREKQVDQIIAEIRKKVVVMEWWNEESGHKRKIMAECLVPDQIGSKYITTIYVPNENVMSKVREFLPDFQTNPSIIPEPKLFFQPDYIRKLNSRISLIKGDLFFSKMQTLTVSVNCVGVMGAGLASRAKYQFPDVYVEYQRHCRSKSLSMGRPVLYKRETSIVNQLADEPQKLRNENSEKWFLLFPTKKHWKEDSDIKGIERGLEWLVKNQSKNKIKSLAIPALGCGLGRLDWREVGPILCKYVNRLDIPVEVYLPAEKNIPEKYLSSNYLL